MDGFVSRARTLGGLLGTWVKIASAEVLELLGYAGFDFVVIDLEHASIAPDDAYRMVLVAQAAGMSALVRLPDHTGSAIQPLLDAGADGLLVPRASDPAEADAITRRMVFAPRGERGLGFTSRAGKWGLSDIGAYLSRGDEQCVRMIQLEDRGALERAADFAALEHVNGLFVGHGDLFLSTGKPSTDPEIVALTRQMLDATKRAEKLSGVAAGTPEDACSYLDMGFSLVMVSNDCTMLGKAAADLVSRARRTG